MKRNALAIAILTGLAGCALPVRHEGPRPVSQDHVVARSYQLGIPKTVSVGEPMVKVQDYWNEITERPVAVPTKSFVIRGGAGSWQYDVETEYAVRGSTVVDGKDYALVAHHPSTPSAYIAALVSPDGTIFNRMAATNLLGTPGLVIPTMTIDPPDAKLKRQISEKVNITKGFVNYEVLYTGISANAMNLTYREFSPEGVARVAFFQNLTYPADAKSITFKQLRIAVDRATADGITFTVLNDGPKK